MAEQGNLDSWWKKDLIPEILQQDKDIIRTPEMEEETDSCKIELRKLKSNIELNIWSEEEKYIQAFLDKVPNFDWYEWSRFQKAVESCSIKIRQVPWKDIFMISSDWKNLNYLLNNNWEIYYNYEYWKKSIARVVWKRFWWELLEWWNINISWKKILFLSDEYITFIIPIINKALQLNQAIIDDYNKRHWIKN